MEARKLKTIDDLLQSDDERVELINGELIKRPMARSEHALIQSSLSDEVSPFKRKDGSGGWWIMPEISVKYSEHHCPSHDLAGWRKERIPLRPTGIMNVIPDWVCEITSPGHERKDLFNNLILLQRSKVPYYWVISPEDKTLIAYALVDEKYHVTFSVEYGTEQGHDKAKIPPFEEVEIDLKYVFGD
ncbi:MAG: Uma2 family endonuclease [Candidatus Competibacteraceae bacterium]|nr:Uma2 family endonuclease [Candidatus Competibacteraceae bacterium]